MDAKVLLVAVVMLFAVQASAGNRPEQGDTWVYEVTFRALDDPAAKVTSDILTIKAGYLNTLGKLVFTGGSGFGMYSDTCLFDIAAGEELAGAVPCDAPLPIGKTWRAALRDPTKAGVQSLAVIGKEDVLIESRLYPATVIRTERALTPWDLMGRGSHVTHRRATYWYVPEIRGMAKIEHELIDDNGKEVTRETYALLKFRRASALADN